MFNNTFKSFLNLFQLCMCVYVTVCNIIKLDFHGVASFLTAHAMHRYRSCSFYAS